MLQSLFDNLKKLRLFFLAGRSSGGRKRRCRAGRLCLRLFRFLFLVVALLLTLGHLSSPQPVIQEVFVAWRTRWKKHMAQQTRSAGHHERASAA